MDIIGQTKPGVTLLTCDVVIAGGGMVGLTLALLLATNPELSIIVLEAKAQADDFTPEQYHHRVSALSLSSVRILQSVEVWSAMQARRVSPFNAIKVWDAKAKSDLTFHSQDIAETVLGYIVENNVTELSLREKILSTPNIQYLSPVNLTAMEQTSQQIILSTKEYGDVRAKLAVAADGANSWLRQKAGIAVSAESYAQEAVVASVVTTSPHDKIARQIFLPEGPLAFLPLQSETMSSIVWSLPVEQARAMLELPAEDFKSTLTRAFGARLGEVVDVSHRFVFPLKKQQAKNYVDKRVVLVGDAAHVVHPLAGQGVNLGLLDAASLAEVLLTAVTEGRDMAQTTVLRRYERWRRAENMTLLSGVDVIKTLFAQQATVMQTVRGFGLALTNRLSSIKNVFTRQAVGSRGKLPVFASKIK